MRKTLKQSNQRAKNKLIVKIYELNHIREIEIDLNVGKDRAKLRHIDQSSSVSSINQSKGLEARRLLAPEYTDYDAPKGKNKKGYK